MPNNLQLAGAQSIKPPRFAPLFTSRFFSGIWTNRSPLRDATTSRIVEKFYGQAGDAIIAGSNIELTNKLTLARRPGTSIFDSNTYTDVDRFYEFRLFNPTIEQINVMVDQANAIYSLYDGVKSLVFTKGTGAGQAYMQSVGNTLYWGDSVDNKKWLQTLTTWTANTALGGANSPFFSTFIIDPNNNIQQLEGAYVICNAINWGDGLLVVSTTVNPDPNTTVVIGDYITFPYGMAASALDGLTLQVTATSADAISFAYSNLTTPTYSGAESDIILVDVGAGTPVSGSSAPSWSTVVPSSGNNYEGGVTLDGSAIWVNRGSTVENWGIDISKGNQLKNLAPSSPSVSETIAGGTSTASAGVNQDIITSQTFSGFTSSAATGNVILSVDLDASITITFPPPSLPGDSFTRITVQISIDSGSTWTTYYTINIEAPTGSSTPYTTSLTNVPISATLSGVANLNTIEVKLITEADNSNLVSGSASVSATLGAISVGTGNNAIAWAPSTAYTAGEIVLDTNNNLQTVTVAGTSGTMSPSWNAILGGNTLDGTVTWENTYIQALSAFNGGYKYAIALVNSLDDTVSNCTVLSSPTGNFEGAQGIFIPPASGLPPISQIDPQADYVAIFRTTDGQSVPFLIPGPGNTPWTVPLSVYISNGYLDHTLDTQLNNLIEGAVAGENTPPALGAINLTFHLDRIWYSIGNVVYWTTGPDTPVGNGINGTSPLNFSTMPSLVKRIVPTSTGAIIFTVSDIYIIQGSGTTTSPIQSALPLIPGIGLLSYNALDFNGSTMGFFTTDGQFLILDPAAGVTNAGFPLGDQFRLNNGQPGTNWNPANIYVTWHVQGEDQAWYIADGKYGWNRLMTTPAPETGYTWSPFATITGGVKTVQSVEITPGVHRLLLGPVGTGSILQRNLDSFSDNGVAYPAHATIGSIVLVQPGQVAEVAHIVTEAARVGSPITLGFLTDEALPYYTGPIEILKNYVSDPPNLKESTSLYSQRFYLIDEKDNAPVMRHCQIVIIFNPNDVVQNELLTLTIFGASLQEQ